MIVDKLTPSPDWAAMATARLVKCKSADYVHFTADFGNGLLVHRLAVLAESERAARWLSACAEVQGIGQAEKSVGGKRAKRTLPDWLESGG
jgi:hypothetical protein